MTYLCVKYVKYVREHKLITQDKVGVGVSQNLTLHIKKGAWPIKNLTISGIIL